MDTILEKEIDEFREKLREEFRYHFPQYLVDQILPPSKKDNAMENTHIGIKMGGYTDENNRLMDRVELNRRISDLLTFQKQATVEIMVLRTHLLNTLGALKGYDSYDVMDLTPENLIESLESFLKKKMDLPQVLCPKKLKDWAKYAPVNLNEEEMLMSKLIDKVNNGDFDLLELNEVEPC